jgi:hypothetical protein
VELLRNMNVSFTQQCCSLEGNTLEIAEVREVWDSLEKKCNLDKLIEDPESKFPSPSSLSKSDKLNEVIEVRNHLLATHLLYSNLYNLQHEIYIDEMNEIHRILLKDLPTEKIESKDGKIQHAGEFRLDDVRAHCFHTIHPVSSFYLLRFFFLSSSILNNFILPIVGIGSS